MTSEERFTVRQISQMVGLTGRQIRSYVSLEILEPEIGPRGRFEFTFQDLVILRSAKAMVDDGVPAVRVHSALLAIKDEQQDGDPLTTFSIVSDGSAVVVVRGNERWDPLTGQELLNLDLDDLHENVAALGHTEDPVSSSEDADEWFSYGDDIDGVDVSEAAAAYRAAIVIDPAHVDARINLGRLLHAEGDVEGALEQFRAAVDLEPDNAIAWFNLGIALDQQSNTDEAIEAFGHSIDHDRTLADAHMNIAELYERQGQVDKALQHLREYRNLVS
ncbi:MAG: tetratricopeptide repeat protein [Acidimicrobiia bacterium]